MNKKKHSISCKKKPPISLVAQSVCRSPFVSSFVFVFFFGPISSSTASARVINDGERFEIEIKKKKDKVANKKKMAASFAPFKIKSN